tara:strand:- start:153 stop:1274 length:1122 start_codon:yes stop_codon:yes gene_type:complete
MDVLVYSALNEQSSLKKQIAAKQKELFDLKANAAGAGAGSYADAPAEAWTAACKWLCMDGSGCNVERYLNCCPMEVTKWTCIYTGSDWTGNAKVCDTTENGGCGKNCTWVVPSGATRARFQLWGAGGGANHAGKCCSWTHFGSTGAYLSVIIPVTSGHSYTVCAGCAYCCYGGSQSSSNRIPGCPSYVQGCNLCYLCAQGGDGSQGEYWGTRIGAENPCYQPCFTGSYREVRVCQYGASICKNSGGYSGNFPPMAGSIYAGTVNIPQAVQTEGTTTKLTPENLIYGIRGIWGGWCNHTNNYGCICHPKVYGFENTSSCVQTYTSSTCCGGGWRYTNGYLQIPSAGGWMSSAHGGCQNHCGDMGRFGMVCIQWK